MAAKMFRTDVTRGPLMRISYAQSLRKPREMNGKVRYGCTLILPKADTAGMKALQKMIQDVVLGEWGEKGVERFKNGLIKNPILDGAGKEARNKKSGEINPGLGEGVVFIRPISNDPVKCFNKAVLPASDDEIKSGYWGHPAFNAFAWTNTENGDGISFGINMLQIVKADELLGGGEADPDSIFEKITTDSGDNGTVGAGGAADLFG